MVPALSSSSPANSTTTSTDLDPHQEDLCTMPSPIPLHRRSRIETSDASPLPGSVDRSDTSPAMDITSKQGHRPRVRRFELIRARPHVMRLFLCLTMLAFGLVLMVFGTAFMSISLDQSIEEAQLVFQAQSSITDRDRIIYGQLNNILTTRLSKIPFESHPECLARGLRTADAGLFDIAFQYPDIRNHVMEWTMDNCHRLFFVPQRITTLSKEHFTLKDWTPANCKVCELVVAKLYVAKRQSDVAKQKVLDFIKSSTIYVKLNSTLQEMFLKKWRLNTHQTWNDVSTCSDIMNAIAHIKNTNAQAYHRMFDSEFENRSPVPFGFTLDCQSTSLCRVVYFNTSGKPDDVVVVSAEAITGSAERVTDLRIAKGYLESFAHFILKAHTITAAFHVFALLNFTVAELCKGYSNHTLKGFSPQKSFNSRFSSDGHYLYLYYLVLLQSFAVPVSRLLVDLETIFDKDFFMAFGFLLILLGSTMVVAFFLPNSKHEDVFEVFNLAKEIWIIMRGLDELTETDDMAGEGSNSVDVENENPGSEPGQDIFNQSTKTTLSSKRTQTFHKFSSTTTIQEDIQAELQAIRNERNAPINDDSDSSTETGTDIDDDIYTEGHSDSGNESISAPSVSSSSTDNNESDWSLVDV